MKIRSRLEFFLAKIAGKNIDIATLVPPVASTTTEELMLAIADRLDNIGDIPASGNGAFLASWDCSTGLPTGNQMEAPYQYKAGDYYRVGKVGEPFTGYTGSIVHAGGNMKVKAIIGNTTPEMKTHKGIYNYLLNNGYDSYENPYAITGSVVAYDILSDDHILDTFEVTGICALDEYTNPYEYTKCICIVTSDGTTDRFYFYEDDDDVLHCANQDGDAGTMPVFSTGTNYKPVGNSYTGAASTTVDTSGVNVGDIYYYDDNAWKNQHSYGAATISKAGVVKMAANVAEAAGDTPTAAEFKALLDALIAAGIMDARDTQA